MNTDGIVEGWLLMEWLKDVCWLNEDEG